MSVQIRKLDVLALIAWLAQNSDDLNIPTKTSDKLIARAREASVDTIEVDVEVSGDRTTDRLNAGL